LIARLLKLDRRAESAFILTAVLINAGNYGIPLNKFAFGDRGEERALIYFVMTVVISNTFGVFLASRGSVSTRRALLNVFRVPLPYAAVLGFALNMGDIEMPVALQRSTSLLGDAASPGMLVVLGVQLSRASIRGRIPPILLASGVRLVVSPLIAVPVSLAFGMAGLTRDVAIVQSAMPTAVISGVLATEFGADSEFVTAVILTSTLFSMATLSVLLWTVM
jgi:predicted permease